MSSEVFYSDPSNPPFAAQRLEELTCQLTALELHVSNRKALQLHSLMTNPRPSANAITRRCCEELRERIEHELEGKAIYFVSSQVELLESTEPLFGLTVDERFPSARFDISEAGKCLALGRSTASVIHLMRALEVGLGCLAVALGLTLTSENWNTVIEKEIRSRTKTSHGKKWKDQDESYYAEAATHFRLVKNAWRNHAAHAKVKYLPEEAAEIFQSVKSFMRHLAKRLGEPQPDALNALLSYVQPPGPRG